MDLIIQMMVQTLQVTIMVMLTQVVEVVVFRVLEQLEVLV